jgi:hypothetical protein
MIGVSVSYVRKLAARKQLVFVADRNGTFVAEWAQIEAFARERRAQMTPCTLIAAKVFEMCKARRPFDEIVSATEQILRLCKHYAVPTVGQIQQAAAADGDVRGSGIAHRPLDASERTNGESGATLNRPKGNGPRR